MSNALLFLGALLITALAALFAVPYFVDWNSYRGVFEEEASRVLGRDVRVGGAVNLHLLPAPYIGFEKVRIADTESEGGTSIFRVESFTMWLSVPPLLRGVVEAHQVELRRPIFQLAIDQEGGGNWRSLSFQAGTLPLVPKDVALQSVKIVDGTVAVSTPARADLVQLEAINGEFSAEALEGPYKFKGTLMWSGEQRNVRVATAKRDGNGEIRFKGSVDAPQTGNSYLLDGRLSDLAGKPRFEGELTAKISLAPETLSEQAAGKEAGVVKVAAPEAQTAAPPQPGSPKNGTPGPSDPLAAPELQLKAPTVDAHGRPKFDLRARLAGDGAGFRLDDVNVMLEEGGPPQLITGSAHLVWAEKMRLDVNLGSKWLDLDRLLGTNNSVTPLEAAHGYFEGLAAVLPAEADTNAALEFDQLNLGGEAVSNVRLSAARAQGPLKLKGLRANLPGGTRLELDGILTPGQKTPKLDGTIAIAGQSLMRFLAWGFRHKTIGDGRSDGAFALDGHFALGDKKINLTEASAEFAGMRLDGEANYEAGEHRRIVLVLDGPRIDAAQFRPGILGAATLRDILALAQPEGEAGETDATKEAPVEGLINSNQTDLALKLRAAEITDGARVVRDVELDMSLERGVLSLPVLKFATPEGLVVAAEGRGSDKQGRAHGGMRGLVDAPTPAAALAFLDLLDLEADQKASAERFARLAPLRLAGSLNFPGDAPGAADITVDGAVDGGRLSATVRLAGGPGSWRSQPLDISATLDAQGVERFLAVSNAGARAQDAAGPQQPGRIVLKVAGTPANGMLSLAQVSSESITADYDGRIALPAQGAPVIVGTVAISARDARNALSIAGLRLGEGAADTALAGKVSVQTRDGTLTLSAEDLAVGASRLRGTVSLTEGDGGSHTLAADLEINTASVAGLMTPILGGALDSALTPAPAATVPGRRTNAPPAAQQKGTAAAATELSQSIWPEQMFDLSTVDGLSGRVNARIGALAIEPGLTVSDVRLAATISTGGVKVESLEGSALGGKLVSRLDFAKAPAGITLDGSLRIDISSKPGAASAEEPGDVAAFSLGFAGRALSPAALIADLKGKGEVALGDATISGMAPGAVTAVAEAALAGKGPTGGEALAQAVKSALKTGQLNLGKIAIPIEIGDGALKLGRVKIESADGRSTFATAIELASMKIDSEWQIEPKVAKPANPGERVLLPAVTVVYVGKLSQIASLEPAVTTGALERELTVRKMERDVDELERLRKLDQQRARQEIERQRVIEEERARNAAPPPAAAADPLENAPPIEQQYSPADAGAAVAPDGTQAQSATGPFDPAAPVDPNAPPLPPGAEAALPAQAVTPPRPRKKKPAGQWSPFQDSPLAPF